MYRGEDAKRGGREQVFSEAPLSILDGTTFRAADA